MAEAKIYVPKVEAHGAGRTYNQLSDFGWNDVASATANFGTRR